MKKIFLTVLFPIVLLATPPSWYIQSNIPTKEYEIVGYGAGFTREEANKKAKSHIANAIQTNVQSSSSIEESEIDGEFKQSTKTSIKESSNVDLSDLKQIKSAYIDGEYFVALKYVNLPFAKKVRLKFSDISQMKQETNTYLIHTPLLQELKVEFGFFPKISIDKNNLLIEKQSFSIDDDTLKKLFSLVDNKAIKIKQPKNIKHSEFYFIDVVVLKSGFVTVIHFYENGGISILYDNEKIIKNTKYSYPNKDEYNGIEAYLEKNVDKTKDLTIALLCKDKKDFSYFDQMTDQKENFAKVYGKLFDTIDGCDVASEMLSIRRQ
ncbi:MAG: LPP20 family lipoprotein [Campylobacterota bacterium]|nr:LPP20 family lipoprotein [Campylobacterota bacterium]